ncbi:hypothetical protein [Dyadobacter sp. CY347]|uniref:hypothetical protein n=1 Tax=Dyadobacter sp. CY347 TaxID=2909336 RepID=UPI001F171C83|nr:hypothetical protein [Dyadobacter sp. CY347]MCF2488752.1 hypothetical protein [Dyadobacter sp. CY347]
MKDIRTWDEVKDEVYGKIGTPYRDQLERESQVFVKRLLSRLARVEAKTNKN